MTHTRLASQFLDHTIAGTSFGGTSSEMVAALTNLRQLVSLYQRQSSTQGFSFPLQQQVPSDGITKLPMPPLDDVIFLLKQTEGENQPGYCFS